MWVKICGVTQLDNALAIAQAGADMLGLNFYPPSPRYIDPDAAAILAKGLRDALGDQCPWLVGVFVNTTAEQIQAITQQVGLDAVQLSGDEPIDLLPTLQSYGIHGFKAIRPTDTGHALSLAQVYHADTPDHLPTLLLDAHHATLYGGTGKQANLAVVAALATRYPRLLIAGGLTPDNVATVTNIAGVWGVDVASGVEGGLSGVKDLPKVREFITRAKGTTAV